MRSRLIALSLALAATFAAGVSTAFSEEARISIKAVDEASGAPVEDAALSAKGPVDLRKIARDGAWTFENVPAGLYELRAWAPGFLEKRGKLEIDPSRKTDYSGTVKLKRIEPATTPKNETVKSAQEDKAKSAGPTPEKGKVSRKAESPKEIAAKLGLHPSPAAPGSAFESKESSGKGENPAETFFGISKGALGIGAVVLIFVILSDMIVFAALTALKWSSMAGRARLGLSMAWAGSGCLSFALLAFCAFGYFVAYDENGRGAPEIQAHDSPKPVANSAAAKPAAKEPSSSERARIAHERGLALLLESPGDQERVKKAIPYLEEAFFAEPGDVRYAIDLADSYALIPSVLSLNLAVEIYKGALEAEPESDMLLARLADSFLKLKRYDKAFSAAARRTWSKTSSPSQGISQLILISVASGQLDRGMQELEKGLLNDPPEKAEYLMAIAALNAEAGRKNDALAGFDAALAELPSNSPLAAKARQLREEAAK